MTVAFYLTDRIVQFWSTFRFIAMSFSDVTDITAHYDCSTKQPCLAKMLFSPFPNKQFSEWGEQVHGSGFKAMQPHGVLHLSLINTDTAGYITKPMDPKFYNEADTCPINFQTGSTGSL